MLTVYEFKLNFTKTQHSGHFGHTCIDTGVPAQVALCWPLPVQVEPVPVQVGLLWAVPVQPCTCTVTASGNCPDLLLLPLLIPIHFIYLPHSLIPQKSSWKSSKTTSQHLNWWFGTPYNKTLGENLMNSTKGPPILHKTI